MASAQVRAGIFGNSGLGSSPEACALGLGLFILVPGTSGSRNCCVCMLDGGQQVVESADGGGQVRVVPGPGWPGWWWWTSQIVVESADCGGLVRVVPGPGWSGWWWWTSQIVVDSADGGGAERAARRQDVVWCAAEHASECSVGYRVCSRAAPCSE